jgi:tRNA(Ile)-lysidine synthase
MSAGGLSAAEPHLDWLAESGRAALAVSGGADSLALMVLMRQAADRVGANPESIVVYSVDHRLRPEAADEVAYVVRTARRMGFLARALAWEGEKPATGVQAAARTARYRLMAAAMREDDKVDLVTAHHMADQAETVLMRLAHGSGIEGLKGMNGLSFVEGCRVSRPLLGVRPEDLRQVVREAGLVPAEDPSNTDPHYERVRWRQFQPQLDAMGLTIERLSLFSDRASNAADLINDSADAAHRDLVTPLDGGGASLPRGQFAVLNPLVRAALLEAILGYVSGNRSPVPLGPLEALCARIADHVPFKTSTLHGCVVAVQGRRLVIRPEGPRRSSEKARLGNAVP